MKNQCDGCLRGLELKEGIHIDSNGRPYMTCSKNRYHEDDHKIDLSKCKEGDELLSRHGWILTYIRPLPEEDYYDHEVRYPNGSKGTRCNDGYVYRNNRDPEYDHDIIEIYRR